MGGGPPSAWESKTFRDVFGRLQYGLTAKAQHRSAGARFLRITDLTDGRSIDWERVPTCDAPDRALAPYILADGDFVFARSGSIEKAARVNAPPRAVFASYLIRGVPVDKNHSDWLAWFIRSPLYLEQVRAAAVGIGLSNVSAKKLEAIIVPLPPDGDRQRIISQIETLFTRSRSARSELTAIPDLIERYKRTLLADALSGNLTRDWRRDRKLPEPRPAFISQLLETPIRNGLSVRGSDEPPGIRSLRLSALRGATVDLDDVRYLPITETKAAKYLLRAGDVLISRGNGTKAFVGIASLVPELHQPTIYPDTAFRIRLAPDKADAVWFRAIWNAPGVRSQIEAAAKTTAGIWKISQGDLAKIEILVPHLEEQAELARRLSQALARIDAIAAETHRAMELVDRLESATLAQAFRGELVPQKPSAGGTLSTDSADTSTARQSFQGKS
jgi:type I restriction enzyme S subunit